jgi:hypothetical protein
MKRKPIKFISSMLCIVPLFTFAQTPVNEKLARYIDLITASLESAEKTQNGMWSYRLVKNLSIDGEKTISVEKYFPSNGSNDKWTLEELNHQKPSNDDISQYLDDKADDAEEAVIRNKFLNFVDRDSIKIKEEHDDYVLFSFKGFYPKFGDAAKGKIDGLLTLDKDKAYVTNLELRSNDEFTTKVVLDIENWNLKISFDRTKSVILQRSRTSTLQGTAMMFADINVTIDLAFTDYIFVESSY